MKRFTRTIAALLFAALSADANAQAQNSYGYNSPNSYGYNATAQPYQLQPGPPPIGLLRKVRNVVHGTVSDPGFASSVQQMCGVSPAASSSNLYFPQNPSYSLSGNALPQLPSNQFGPTYGIPNQSVIQTNQLLNGIPYAQTNPNTLMFNTAPHLSVNQFSSNAVNPYQNPYMTNQFSTGGPALVDSHGVYHGQLNGNPYDANSISNPYGRYGSKYSADSINNQFGAGNPYAVDSPYNRFGTGMRLVSP